MATQQPFPSSAPESAQERKEDSPRRLNELDRAVLLVTGVILLLIVLVILRGDRVGLQVVALSPPANTQGVAVGSTIAAKFDGMLAQSLRNIQEDAPANMDGLSQPAVTFSPPVSATITTQGDELLITPLTPMLPGTEYTVTIAAGIAGAGGRDLLQPVVWRFRTGSMRILYSALDASQMNQLYIMNFRNAENASAAATAAQGATQAVAITRAEQGIWDFAIAPNGTSVLFSALNNEGGADLWQVQPDGGEASLLLACPNAACSEPTFSPNGALVAYGRRNRTDQGNALISPPRLWLLDMASGESVPVFADSQKLSFEPRFSGDGAWISYVSPELAGVGVINLDDGREFFYPGGNGQGGVWHPLHTALVVAEMTTIDGQYAVHMILHNIEESNSQNLSGAGMLVDDDAPAWSPDGAWIAFRRKEFTGAGATPGKQIWIMRADGTDARPLTQDAEFDHGAPSWSADGRTLLYHRYNLRNQPIIISVIAHDVASGEWWIAASPGQRPRWLQ